MSSKEDETQATATRILIQTVGTGSPQHPVWEALAKSFTDLQPDLLIQLCSHQTIQETIPKFLDEISESAREICQAIDCGDPDDVEHLINRYDGIIRGLLTAHPNAEVHVDFTSGTKPMSAALVAVAISNKLPYLRYATGPRDQGGRSTSTEAFQEINTSSLVAEKLLNELGSLFNQGQFLAVSRQAKVIADTLPASRQKDKAVSLAKIAEVYSAWEQFNWKAARHQLRQLKNKEGRSSLLAQTSWNIEQLDRQFLHLQNCETNEPTKHREADLFANAKRRISQGQFDDAVLRLYRLTELILQERFFIIVRKGKGNPDNPTSKVTDEILDSAKSGLASEIRKRKGASEKLNLGLSDAMEVLSMIQDPVGLKMWDDYTGGTGKFDNKTNGPFFSRLDRRNNSWLAHGTKSIEKNVADELAEDVEKYFKLHLQHPVREDESQIGYEELDNVTRFLKCPWVD